MVGNPIRNDEQEANPGSQPSSGSDVEHGLQGSLTQVTAPCSNKEGVRSAVCEIITVSAALTMYSMLVMGVAKMWDQITPITAQDFNAGFVSTAAGTWMLSSLLVVVSHCVKPLRDCLKGQSYLNVNLITASVTMAGTAGGHRLFELGLYRDMGLETPDFLNSLYCILLGCATVNLTATALVHTCRP